MEVLDTQYELASQLQEAKENLSPLYAEERKLQRQIEELQTKKQQKTELLGNKGAKKQKKTETKISNIQHQINEKQAKAERIIRENKARIAHYEELIMKLRTENFNLEQECEEYVKTKREKIENYQSDSENEDTPLPIRQLSIELRDAEQKLKDLKEKIGTQLQHHNSLDNELNKHLDAKRNQQRAREAHEKEKFKMKRTPEQQAAYEAQQDALRAAWLADELPDNYWC
jgi:chromosome segregation ATPase